jgi:hypothetical protein
VTGGWKYGYGAPPKERVVRCAFCAFLWLFPSYLCAYVVTGDR